MIGNLTKIIKIDIAENKDVLFCFIIKRFTIQLVIVELISTGPINPDLVRPTYFDNVVK